MKRKNKQYKQNKSNSGITLIALVVTIVILLILAGVTINLMFSENGIIKKAQDAGNTWNEAIIKDQDSITDLTDQIGSMTGQKVGEWYYCNESGEKTSAVTKYVTDGTPNLVIEVGSTINNYNPGNQTYQINAANGATAVEPEWDDANKVCILEDKTEVSTVNLNGWQVLGVSNDGLLEIVSRDDTDASNVTDRYSVYLANKEGYSKGPQELTNICNALYGQGEYAKEARSINIEDIEKFSTFEKENYDDGYGWKLGDTINFWNTKASSTDTSNAIYFSFANYTTNRNDSFTDEDGVKWYPTGETEFHYYKNGKWEELGEGEKDSLEYTYYNYSLSECFNDNTITEALKHTLTTGSDTRGDFYWLASPTMNFEGDYIYFLIFQVNSGNIFSESIYYSDGDSSNSDYGLRPVVSLKSNITLQPGETEGTYNIVRK